jgi:hypothetical protein
MEGIIGIKKEIYIIGEGFNPFKVVRLIAHRRNYYCLRHYRCRKTAFSLSESERTPAERLPRGANAHADLI